MELCPKCKEYYKGVQYPTCIQCLPEEKRKAALENIEFGKEWRAMNEGLGIDQTASRYGTFIYMDKVLMYYGYFHQ